MVSGPAVVDAPSGDSALPVVRRPIFRALARAFAGALLGLVGVDRWVFWQDSGQLADTSVLLADPLLGWRLRPGFSDHEVRLDSRGMRNDEVPADAAPTEVRVLGAGASELYGKGAPQAGIWSSRLEAALRERHGPSWRVLNGAVMAYSGVQACRRAGQLADELAPDLVLVSLGTGAQYMLDPSAARSFVPVGTAHVPRDILEGWPEALYPALAAAHGVLKHSGIYTRHRARFRLGNDDRAGNIQRWILSRREEAPEVAEMLGLTFGEIALLIRTAEREGFELRFVVLPELAQADDERWEWYLRSFASEGAPARGTPRDEPTRTLIERIEALGGRAWDFTPEVEQHWSRKDEMLVGGEADKHWSERGHAVIAAGMLARLEAEGLPARLAAARRADPRD